MEMFTCRSTLISKEFNESLRLTASKRSGYAVFFDSQTTYNFFLDSKKVENLYLQPFFLAIFVPSTVVISLMDLQADLFGQWSIILFV